MHDLSEADTQVLISETVLVGRMLKVLTGCEKVNTATIGNIVRQLHVHVIARSQGDANWPGPVWGYGTKTLYSETAYGTLIKRIQRYDL